MPLASFAIVGLLTTATLAVLPASFVAEKELPDGSSEATPYARTPASAQPVDDRLTFGELGGLAEQFPPAGEFYFVTVTEPSQSILSWLLARDHPAVQFLTRREKFGDQTPQQRRTFALESMRTASQEAQYVALQRVGFDVGLLLGDVLIGSMVCFEVAEDNTCAATGPSDRVLDPGDKILSVDGEPVDTVEDLARILGRFAPGDLVDMRIERPGLGELAVEVELTVSPDDPERTIVGFVPFDTTRVVLPFELDIDTGSIGGPSAGLAFSLALIDQLTPGELTGGRRVAVTGEIELDGSVRAIGGLPQKASAVAQTGVEIFLVPASQPDLEAARRAGGPNLEIVPVATLEEALQALAQRGGDPIPPPPAGADQG